MTSFGLSLRVRLLIIRTEPLPEAGLGHEFEWENDPELSIVLVDSIEHAVKLCNEHSPHFVVSVLTDEPELVESVYASADAPFVGNGFTRWVDGQYALGQPELGLSNWRVADCLDEGRAVWVIGAHVALTRTVF